MPAPISPSELQSMLEWAGARFLSLPPERVKPSEYRSFWPDYVSDVPADAPFSIPIRPASPSSEEITLMEEILYLPNILSDQWKRRIVHCRLLVFPISGRYMYKWTQIGRLLGTSREKVRQLHRKGIKEIGELTPGDKMGRLFNLYKSHHH